MSLTTFLNAKGEGVRQHFRQTFPAPRMKTPYKRLVSSRSGNPKRMGVAFDYLMRFILERYNSNCITSSWVAEYASEVLQGQQRAKAESVVRQAREAQTVFLANGELTLELCQRIYALAELDVVYRGGVLPTFAPHPPEAVEELLELALLVNPDDFIAHDKCYLNPTFGKGSCLVGGADADVILDDMLLEIKTVQEDKFYQKHYTQLLGYLVLNEFGSVNGEDDVTIRRLGVYFSRHGQLHVVEIGDLTQSDKFKELTVWVRHKAESLGFSRIHLGDALADIEDI